ncbi:HlyD family type I secretion periplasmic adaptor subunit [Dongia sp.]|uniref:HlyD family type I secretion periplasmic adaptor subunit n=1 Tax=Dongia sp. TaxID=1977262 RepID=UPI00374FEA1B
MSLTNRDLWIDPAETEREGIQRFGHILLGAILFVVFSFLVWSYFASLDQITRGEGKVIPSSQTQIMQSLDGGTLQEMRVREGDVVEKDQVLLVIDNSTAIHSLAELKQRYYIASAAIARLQAEIAGKSEPAEIDFPDDVEKDAPDKIAQEQSQFVIRQNQLSAQLTTLRDQIEQRKQDINAINTKISSAAAGLDVAEQQVAILGPAVAAGAASKVDLLKAKQEAQNYRSELNNARASLPSAKSALQESQSKLSEAVATFKAESAGELAKQQSDLASVRESMKEASAKVGRTELRSPVKGTVKEIKARTLGGVIQPAQDIMEIVPIEDNLLIEAQIRPQDRGFIAPNQKAKVKITAYDYSIYGGLDATLEQISADAIENEKKELFFRVRLRTDKNFLVGKQGEQLPIIPGMTATVDILTGNKTVLEYLLKPILKARDTALTER